MTLHPEYDLKIMLARQGTNLEYGEPTKEKVQTKVSSSRSTSPSQVLDKFAAKYRLAHGCSELARLILRSFTSSFQWRDCTPCPR